MADKPFFATKRAEIIVSYAAAWLFVVVFLLLLHHVFKLYPDGQPEVIEYLEEIGFALGAGLLFWLLSNRHLHKIEAVDRQLVEFAERTRTLSESHARLAGEIAAREQTEKTLREIYEGTAAAIGVEFFRSATQHLASALNVRHALAGELLDGTPRKLRTLAVWNGSDFLANGIYPLDNTPCGAVVDQDTPCGYAAVEETSLAGCALLRELGATSYLGAPLHAPDGRLFGILAVMDSLPIAEANSRAGSILGIFAARAAAEMQRLRAENALRESRARLAAIINGAMDAIVSVDAHHRVVLFNPAAEVIFRCPAEDAVGKPLDRFIPAPCRERHRRHVLEFGRTGAIRRSTLNMGPGFTALRADGEPFPFEASISKVETGGDILYTVILRDLTEQRRLQERAREWERQLLKAGHLVMLGEMATTLAHELNQPLTAIAGYAEGCIARLRSGAADPVELTQAMEQAAAQAMRAGDIIRTVRGFAKKREMVRTPVDVNQIAREMAGFAEHQANAHSVVLALDLAPALPTLLADKMLVELVMVNLIRNGIESMAGMTGRRRLEIGTLLSGPDKICVSVRDSGQGLPTGAAGNVLDPFFTTKPDGMGMGLAISRSIVESHGGTLWFEPNAGRGTTFYFSLPIPSQ